MPIEPAHTQDERTLGKKSKRPETDRMPYYDDFARIFYLNDARKMAKTQLCEAQKVYEECCSDLAKEKQQFDSIFKEICSDDELTISKD